MKPLRLLTMVWGKHLELFSKVLLRSLFQPGNLPAIFASGREVEVFLMTPERDRANAVARLSEAAQGHQQLGCSWVEGVHLADGLVSCMTKCLDDGSLLMLTPPDTFFADGSISNLLNFHADREGMCVSGFHVRVLEKEFLEYLDWTIRAGEQCGGLYDIGSEKLVDLAFEYAHDSFKYAQIDNTINNSRHGGVFIQKVKNGLWAIMHRLPTVYLASITSRDVDRFKDRRQFNDWDWSWPAKLMLDKRYKCCASSDLFFAVELTPAGMNVPLLEKDDRLVDEFTLRDYHFDLNRFIVGVLRGTNA